MESVVIGQMLPHRRDVDFFNLMENFNVGIALTATYLLSFLAILALAYLLNELAYRIRFGERRIAKFSKKVSLASTKFRIKISKQRVSAIGWFILFIHWFMWITELFLTNNIKVPERPTGLSLKLEVIWFSRVLFLMNLFLTNNININI